MFFGRVTARLSLSIVVGMERFFDGNTLIGCYFHITKRKKKIKGREKNTPRESSLFRGKEEKEDYEDKGKEKKKKQQQKKKKKKKKRMKLFTKMETRKVKIPSKKNKRNFNRLLVNITRSHKIISCEPFILNYFHQVEAGNTNINTMPHKYSFPPPVPLCESTYLDVGKSLMKSWCSGIALQLEMQGGYSSAGVNIHNAQSPIAAECCRQLLRRSDWMQCHDIWKIRRDPPIQVSRRLAACWIMSTRCVF